MDESCIFKFRYGSECKDSSHLSQTSGSSRLDTIINASKVYGDELHVTLEKQRAEHPNLTVFYHKNCVSKYTSKSNLVKYQTSAENAPPAKKLRRSSSEFEFMKHCLYCGQLCNLDKDPKNPERWNPAYKCRSTVSEHDRTPYKQYLLTKCDDRADSWAEEVRGRLQAAISDLHAVEARYHKHCMSLFFSKRNLTPCGSSVSTTQVRIDEGLHHITSLMSDDKSRIWNSVDLFSEYQEHHGSLASRKQLIEKLRNHFGDELIVLSCPGYARVIAFQSGAAATLKMVRDDDDDISANISKLAKEIKTDCKEMTCDKSKYALHLDGAVAGEAASDTLLTLLAALSPKLDKTLPALLIGNIVTSVITNQATALQIALGVLLRDSKAAVNHMYSYRVTCSYDELLRFKKSAAAAAIVDPCHQGISDAKHGMVQVIADNFDVDISSPNGKLSTHSLAMIVTQVRNDDETNDKEHIPRLKKEDLQQPLDDGQGDEIAPYHGQKTPPMPGVPAPDFAVAEIVQQRATVSRQRADECDCVYFQDVGSDKQCPQFNGYNTRLAREQGHALRHETKIAYLPLIDRPPAESTTMMAALLRAEEVSSKAGQQFVVFTVDQQLYRIALHIIWENPVRFSNFYLRLGGMHLLMSYIGCVGTLMADSGIVEILSAAFGGVLKMLTGKKYPQNVRALRMLVEELLQTLFQSHPVQCMADLQDALDGIAAQSKTSKLWVDCLIRPVFTMLTYIRAEREADWPLHLQTVQQMMPLFFAAGHTNYARYGLYYLRSMQEMPSEVRKHFDNGEHTVHHTPGLFNGIWSDMAIEQTFMRYGKGRNGIVGITLKPSALKTWAYSIHTCNGILNDLVDMSQEEKPPGQTHHKEEMKSRIKSDEQDKQELRQKLELCIDPLDPEQHPPEGLVNIVTGMVVNHPSVNAHNAVQLGKTKMEAFENTWPESFHETIPRVVTTMSLSRKHLKVGQNKVFDTETFYARAMCLQTSSRGIDTTKLLAHELAPFPTSMFDESGHMREAKTKSNLKNALKVDTSSRSAEKDVDAVFLDGCAVLWVVSWPTAGTVQDYLDRFRTYLHKRLKTSDVYLVFDR